MFGSGWPSGWSTVCNAGQYNCETSFTAKTTCENYNGVCFWIGSKCSYKNKYVVSFEANDGTCDNSSCLNTTDKSDGTIYLPTPIKAGYDFKGWYKESTFETQWNEDDTVSGDQTLYAKWKIKTFKVKYNTDTTGNIVDGKRFEYGNNFTYKNLTTEKPNKTGYTFICWSLSSSQVLLNQKSSEFDYNCLN